MLADGVERSSTDTAAQTERSTLVRHSLVLISASVALLFVGCSSSSPQGPTGPGPNTDATAAAPCGLIASPSSIRFTAAGGSGTVDVTRTQGSNCAWTAVTGPGSFVTITSGASGTNTGTVAFTVAANADTAARLATITVAGQLVSITQDGRTTPCQLNVTPASFTFGPSGGTGTVAVTTVSGSNCAWTAASSSPFISVTAGASGTNNGTVTFAVAPNTGAARNGTLVVAGTTIAVAQGVSSLSGTFQGGFNSTPTVPFGGAPYCNYSIVLTNVTSVVEFADNRITRAQVSAVAVESALQGCPFGAIPPNTHQYTIRSSSINGANVTIDYTAAAANAPHATLQFVGRLSDDTRSLAGTLTWQRDDQGTAPSLNWRVVADVTMRQ
jgi:hypothetical protein